MTGEFTIAVHALVFLNHKRCTISSEALAENVCTNPARVRKVMAKLKKAGLVTAREGAEGGYLFEGEAGQLSLCRILEAVDTPVVQSTWKSGSMDAECLVSSGMAEIMDGICRDLDLLCRERLGQITVADIDRKIFGGND